MALTVHPNLVQGSEEWLEQRRGLITASAVGQLITTRTLGAIEFDCPACSTSAGDPCVSVAKGKTGAVLKNMHPDRAEFARQQNTTVITPADGDYARNLTLVLAAERITGWSDPIRMTDDMIRGVEDEPFARAVYAEHYAPVEEVGFMTEDRFGFSIGYSPDGLVGEVGLIEIKSRRAKKQLETVLNDEVPEANMAQIQCGLLVSGREWCDYISFCGGMNLFVKRVYPKPEWQSAIIQAAIAFEETVTEMIRTYRARTSGKPMTERRVELEIII